MIIKNRHKKQYSEKLFNELSILDLLISSENKAYLYILKKKLNKSKRTYYRYFDDLHINGILPEISLHKETKYKFFYMPSINTEDIYDYQDLIDKIKEYLEKRKRENSNKAHKVKLYRMSLLLLENMYNYVSINYIDEYKEIYPLTLNGEIYDFENFNIPKGLYNNVSIRTKQREVNLIKKIIAYMYEP